MNLKNLRVQLTSSMLLLAFLGDTAWSQADIVLSETWVPGSHEVINCGGGTIRPAVPATVSGGAAVPSAPDTLIYLKDVNGVKIRNCILEDATFGIYVVGGGGHSIDDNTIDATAAAVHITASHYNSVTKNTLAATSRSIGVTEGSIGNIVIGNDLTFKPGPDQLAYPGLPGLAGFQYQLATGSQPLGGVANIIVNGELRQVPATVDNFTENTLVLQNTVNNAGGSDGITFAVRSRGSKAISNTVNDGFFGLITRGYPDGDPGLFILPGACSDEPERYCATDADCDLPGFDLEPLGTCEGATVLPSESRRVIDSEFVGNTVSDAFFAISMNWTNGFRLEDNDVEGSCVGIDLEGYSLEGGAVRGNTVSSEQLCGGLIPGPPTNIGLVIFNALSSFAAVEVSYNDFGETPTPFFAAQFDPVVFFGPYTLPTTLPDNWWGTSCADGGFPSNPVQWANTGDPAPFAEPVAEAYRVNVNKANKKAKCF